jgi:hypothetical protein
VVDDEMKHILSFMPLITFLIFNGIECVILDDHGSLNECDYNIVRLLVILLLWSAVNLITILVLEIIICGSFGIAI